ncbi:MAG: hypothetical protein KVP17_002901 [Porospora cf. gigantea B]|uniref:uncharacterized protein n=2 Tax=Porospora cf. gigantea B TaxID=2853592 RepID=UPI003571B171|nr:MAG: hypothetical protein KVP17_002901 [Porospora cf. gigantea B]
MNELLGLIRSLKQNEDAWPFLAPVDWKAMELLDYPTVINHPMDLSTVEKNVKAGDYSTSAEVLEDIDQIWSNCVLYNGEGSDYAKMAENMRASTSRLKAKLQMKAAEVPLEQLLALNAHIASLDSFGLALVTRYMQQQVEGGVTPVPDTQPPGHFRAVVNLELTQLTQKDFQTLCCIVWKLRQASHST